jgi:hypothetical protein
MADSNSLLAFGCGACVLLAFAAIVAAVILLALRDSRQRSAAWRRSGEALGLEGMRSRRPPEELGPGVSALMAGALLLGDWTRLVGRWGGEEVELLLRGETGSQATGQPFRAQRRVPLRSDFTHVRVQAGRRRPLGLVLCSRRALLEEVSGELGPPLPGIGDPALDEKLAVWAGDPGTAAVLSRPEARPVLLEIDASGGLVCANDLWVCVEREGCHTEAPALEGMLRQATVLARALRSVA